MCFIFCRACIVPVNTFNVKIPEENYINSRSNLVFSLVEFGLRYIQPIIKLSHPDKFILHQVDSRKFPFCSISIAGMLFLMYKRTPLPLVRSELKHV